MTTLTRSNAHARSDSLAIVVKQTSMIVSRSLAETEEYVTMPSPGIHVNASQVTQVN